MKLRDIYIICKNNYEDFVKIYNEIYSKIDNHKALQSDLCAKLSLQVQKIKDLDYLSYLTNEILIESEHLSKHASVDIGRVGVKNMLDKMNKLMAAMEGTMKLCENFDIREQKIGLDVKLPDNPSLTDLKEYIEELEFIFTKCPFFKDENEDLKFKNLEMGSIWLSFVVVGGTLAVGSKLLNNIAAFIDKCFIIKSHKLTIEQQKNEVEKTKMDIEEKRRLYDSMDKVYRILVENSIKELEEISYYKLKDGDEKGRTEQSFTKMIKLLDKGLEISASIESPKEAKVLFEPIKVHFINNNPKLSIEDKNDESEKD